MSLLILPVNQVFGKYEQQARLADLNKKSPVKTIQMQIDRVSISPESLKRRAINAALEVIQASNSKKEFTATLNIEEKSLPLTGEKKSSKDVTESIPSEEIVSDHFKNNLNKIVAEELAKKKIKDDQITHF
jgi:hypothetical protein